MVRKSLDRAREESPLDVSPLKSMKSLKADLAIPEGAKIGLKPRDRAILSDSSPRLSGLRMAIVGCLSLSDRATTSPTTRIAGAWTSCSFALSTISPRVSTTTLSSGLHPLSMRAAGVFGSRPPRRRAETFSASLETPIRTTMVPPTRARASQSSSSSFPGSSWPVRMVTWEAYFRWVSGIPTAPGTARALVTPETSSTGTPCSLITSSSSPPLPNRKGSPPFNRTTFFPSLAFATIRASMSSCSRVCFPPNFPQSIFSALSGRVARISSPGSWS